MVRRRTHSTASEGSDASDHFVSINERPVDDIRYNFGIGYGYLSLPFLDFYLLIIYLFLNFSLEFFYKPHTLMLMFVCVCGITWTAFTRDQTRDLNSNIVTGLIGVTVFFMIVSTLTLPNGPFTRPHPALWRCVLGLYSVRFINRVRIDMPTHYLSFDWLTYKNKN